MNNVLRFSCRSNDIYVSDTNIKSKVVVVVVVVVVDNDGDGTKMADIF